MDKRSERHNWNSARRLYAEGYGLTWIKRYTGYSEEELLRVLQLPFGVQGPMREEGREHE